jgi:hypothetical protein
MRTFRPLAATGLPEGFDAETHTEEPIVEVSESEGKITLAFTFPGFYLSDDDRVVDDETVPFQQVNIAKTGFVGESGKPLLPSFGRYVRIPFNTDYQVSVATDNPVQFEDVLVTPAQQLLTDGPEADHQFEYDRDAYESDALYPKDIVEVSGPHVIDGYNALLVHVRPLQYSPAKRILYGYGSIKVNIALTPRDQGEEAHPLPGAEPAQAQAAALRRQSEPRRHPRQPRLTEDFGCDPDATVLTAQDVVAGPPSLSPLGPSLCAARQQLCSPEPARCPQSTRCRRSQSAPRPGTGNNQEARAAPGEAVTFCGRMAVL